MRKAFSPVTSNYARRHADTTTTVENAHGEQHMKFILSFLIATALLSANTSLKLSLGNAALNDNTLCNPVNIFTPPTPIQCPPVLKIPTVPTIQCNLPVPVRCPPPVVAKCTPAPVICPPPVTPPIECPAPKCPTTPVPPSTPNCATPEPASTALFGVGLLAVGIVRRFRAKK